MSSRPNLLTTSCPKSGASLERDSPRRRGAGRPTKRDRVTNHKIPIYLFLHNPNPVFGARKHIILGKLSRFVCLDKYSRPRAISRNYHSLKISLRHLTGLVRKCVSNATLYLIVYLMVSMATLCQQYSQYVKKCWPKMLKNPRNFVFCSKETAN